MRKILNHEIKVKLNRIRLYPTPSVKHLGVKIDENLNWRNHIFNLAAKLNRAKKILFKISNYVNQKILRSIYFGILDSHLNYANLIWAQNYNAMVRIVMLQQKKAIRIIPFQPRNSHSNPFFQKNNVLKFRYKTIMDNILFISKALNSMLASIFKKFCSAIIFTSVFYERLSS